MPLLLISARLLQPRVTTIAEDDGRCVSGSKPHLLKPRARSSLRLAFSCLSAVSSRRSTRGTTLASPSLSSMIAPPAGPRKT
eukprot:scaffold113377_cov34-Prasinocladus_malaysianus.AAC.1